MTPALPFREMIRPCLPSYKMRGNQLWGSATSSSRGNELEPATLADQMLRVKKYNEAYGVSIDVI